MIGNNCVPKSLYIQEKCYFMEKAKILAFVVVTILLLSITDVYAKSETKISDYVFDELEKHNSVKVDVYLENPKTHKLLSEEKMNSLINNIGSEKVIEIYAEAIVVELTEDEINNLAKRSEGKYIAPSLELVPMLNYSVQIVDANLVWTQQINGVNLTGAEQSVCVIDKSVDFSHPDLAAKNIVGNVLDCTAGIDCPIDENPYLANGNHGTHVAGIVGASGGISGIGKGADLISLNVFPDGSTLASSVIIKRAFDWCVSHSEEYNISVITMSLGTITTFTENCDYVYPPLTESVNYAVENNIAVTMAAGNSGNSTAISSPACITSVIPVSATTKLGGIAWFTNYNQLVKLFAPGVNILSTCNNSTYCSLSGTSMSAPMVAGSIAIIQQYLKMTGKIMHPKDIEDILYETGEPINGLSGNYSRININNAITKLKYCAADLNNDWNVDSADIPILLGAWGPNPGSVADIAPLGNVDGVVDSADLAMLLGTWDKC